MGHYLELGSHNRRAQERTPERYQGYNSPISFHSGKGRRIRKSKALGVFRQYLVRCESNYGVNNARHVPQTPATHLIPTRSPTLTCEFSHPGPSLTTTPTPSWPPTCPSWVGNGSGFHCSSTMCQMHSSGWLIYNACTHGICHDAKIRVTNPGMSPVPSTD